MSQENGGAVSGRTTVNVAGNGGAVSGRTTVNVACQETVEMCQGLTPVQGLCYVDYHY